MASNPPEEMHLDISGTFGISYIGAMVAMVLYGITTLQTYLYFNSAYCPKDPLPRKLLVTTIWCLETLQVALVCHAMYHYLIINYSNPSALQTGIWSLFTSILANVIISTLVQIFFAIRVHKLSRMWWLSILIMVTILAHVAFGIETVALMLILKQLEKLPSITYTAALPFAITAVFPDVLIACSLCYFLQTRRPRIEGEANAMLNTLKGTNAMLNTLIIYAVNRCLLTSVVVIIEVILFRIFPDSFYFLAVDFCVGKLYANSMLAALNSREYVGRMGHDAEPTNRSATTPQFRSARQIHGNRNDSLELTDLSTSWPSGLTQTQTSVESVPGIQADLRRMTKRTEKKNELDYTLTVPMDVVAVDETVGSESEREPSQKRVSLTA